MRWHLFCRVVDNFGDIGVAWRLAADLASRGEVVRLAVDDAGALAWMAPQGAAGVEVCAWTDVATTPPDVVVELFGGGIPDAVAASADAVEPATVFVNIEHLSAETYVERSHGLPSPRKTAARIAFTVWYFYPGFNAATGGLLRGPGSVEERHGFDAGAWLASIGAGPRAGERRVSLFCYAGSAVGPLIDALSDAPTLLLLAHGTASEQARACLGPSSTRGALRAVALPPLSQLDFDRLLRACDLNLVRGEDSLVRAVWAGAPFVWQLYTQGDGAHRVKLAAFLDRFLADATAPLASGVRALFERWNAGGDGPLDVSALRPPVPEAWAAHCRRWRDDLAARDDLVTQLLRFVGSKR